MRGVAINVGANTGQPGFRAPVWPDGRFEFIPIPESEPTDGSVPTYGDLASHLETSIPDPLADVPVHLDPEFGEYPYGERYTYGDEHGVKAAPLSGLSAGDYVFFYATLESAVPAEASRPAWMPPTWGAFVVGQFRLERDPVTGQAYAELGDADRARFATNAHVRRQAVDARVLLAGDPAGSGLYETAVPLSTPEGGTEANELVLEHSADSGKGPWWRRPLRLDPADVSVWLDRAPAKR